MIIGSLLLAWCVASLLLAAPLGRAIGANFGRRTVDSTTLTSSEAASWEAASWEAMSRWTSARPDEGLLSPELKWRWVEVDRRDIGSV